MAGTKDGGAKAGKSNLAKDPDFYRKIAKKSWENPNRNNGRGFAALSKEKHLEVSRKGGLNKGLNRRKPA